MPVIKCKECSAPISDKAPACATCGALGAMAGARRFYPDVAGGFMILGLAALVYAATTSDRIPIVVAALMGIGIILSVVVSWYQKR